MEATNESRRLMLRRDADAGDPPKLPGALQSIADHLRPAFFTTAPGIRPDIGRGMGDARDRGLDAAARDATNIRPLGGEAPSLSETQTAASVDASVARARAAAEAGAGDGDASAALTTLLAQLNRAYPNRNVGRQDGIQVEGNRFALAITADTEEHIGARLPSLASLASLLAKDPRFEKAETQKPTFWNSIDKVYLRIFTRAGAPSEDASPWHLGAGGESGAPLDLDVTAVDDEALMRSLGRRQRDLATAARAVGQGAAELVRTVGVTLAQLRAAARVSLPPGFDLSAVDDDAIALVLTGEQKRAVREARDAGMNPAEIVQAAGITVAQLRAAARVSLPPGFDLSAVDDDALALVLTAEQKRAVREARDAGMSRAEIVQAAGITVAQLRAATRPATEARGAIDPFRRLSAGETGSTQLDQAGNEAKKGLAIGGTVGTALEAVPPPFGQLLHGAAMVLGAIGGFFAGLGRDTFHPNALQALAWLTIFQIAPGMLFSGVDTITTKSGNREHPAEDLAARLVRYFLLISGIVKNVQGDLYNPTDTRCTNPVMCSIIPRYPLTNPKETRRIWEMCERRVGAAPEIHSKVEAQAAMKLLRKTLGPSGLMDWSQMKANLPYIRRAVRIVRHMAGESLPDAKLTKLLQGDVTPLAPREHSRPIRAVPIPLRLGRGVPAATRRPGAPSGGPIDPFHGLRGQAGRAPPALRDPFSGLPPGDTGDAGDSDTGAAGRAALGTLLEQIDERWPLRKRGMLDGLVSEAQHTGFLHYEPRTTLRVSEDNRTNGATPLGPNILALLHVLRADPRTETTEILKPDLWTPLDISYLKVTVKRGACAQDPRPWDLSALDLPITPEAGGLGPSMGRWQSTMSTDAEVHAHPAAGARDPFAGLGSLPVT